MNIDYEKIHQSINEYGRYILNCIKNQYSFSLTQEQLQNIETLLSREFIVIEKPTQEDIEFFSNQEGITNPEDYSPKYIPSAHGGRTKEDNKIHIYPYTKSFNDCKNNDEIINSCINDIVVHEIFHYFIRPNLSNENDNIKDEFGHFLTEGLVQYYAEQFSKKYRLGDPKTNYGKNVDFVKKLLNSFPNDLKQSEIDKIIFTRNQDELLRIDQNGNLMYQAYVDDFKFKEDISSFIMKMGTDIGMKKEDENLIRIIKHYKTIEDINIIFDDLSKHIETYFKNNNEKKDSYNFELQNVISNKKLKEEMSRYEEKMKTILPTEEQIKK